MYTRVELYTLCNRFVLGFIVNRFSELVDVSDMYDTRKAEVGHGSDINKFLNGIAFHGSRYCVLYLLFLVGYKYERC